jgi:hypothetical protein
LLDLEPLVLDNSLHHSIDSMVPIILVFLLLNLGVPIASFSPTRPWTRSGNRQPWTSGNRRGSVLSLPAAQLLTFQEPRTNTTVILVGAMHYNPASIRLARTTIEDLGTQNKLGSVIVESCDIRWNKMAELYEEKPFLKRLLTNEMRTACDVAFRFERPVILGDQRINITTNALKSSLKETFVDLVTPPKGWKRFVDEVGEAWEETVPLGGKGYLNAFAFLDPLLLLALPVSFVKYPLSFLIRDPFPTTIVLSVLISLSYYYADDPMTLEALMTEQIPVSDYITSFVVAVLETAVFARLLLKPLLADRNEILARSILDQCELFAASEEEEDEVGERQQQQQQQQQQGGRFNLFAATSNNQKMKAISSRSDEEDQHTIMYAPGSAGTSSQKDSGGSSGKVVVAVLGMAHCNGIMKLLKEQRV